MSSLKTRFSSRLKYLYLRYLCRIKTPKDLIGFMDKRYCNHELIVQDGRNYTFRDINQNANRFCQAAISAGLKKGDKVAVLLQNSVEYIEIRFACYKCGFVFCAFTDDFDNRQILDNLEQVECSLFVYDKRVSPDLLDEIKQEFPGQLNLSTALKKEQDDSYKHFIDSEQVNEPISEVYGHETSAIGFTSGTTGSSKAVVWAHQAWIYSFYHFLLSAPKADSKDRVFLHILPFSTAGSLSILPGLASGSKNVLLREFNAETVSKAIEQYKVTNMVISPPFMIELWDYYLENQDKLDFTSLKNISIGSAALAQSKLKKMVETFGPIIQQGYGMAEALAPLAAYRYEKYNEAESSYKTVGRPLNQIKLKLQPIEQSNFSRILVRSKTCCEGYWLKGAVDKSCFNNAWFITSDLGVFDDQGQLYVLDREMNIVRYNGVERLVREIEEIIHCCPGVKDVAVYLDDGKLKAGVSVMAGVNLSVETIKLYCLEHCPENYIPDSIRILPTLPYSKSGKVLKSFLSDSHQI